MSQQMYAFFLREHAPMKRERNADCNFAAGLAIKLCIFRFFGVGLDSRSKLGFVL